MHTTQAQALEALKIGHEALLAMNMPMGVHHADARNTALPVLKAAIAALSSPSSTVMDEKGEREKFEAWFVVEGDAGFLGRRTCALDEYVEPDVQASWEAWQARAALTAPAPSAAEQWDRVWARRLARDLKEQASDLRNWDYKVWSELMNNAARMLEKIAAPTAPQPTEEDDEPVPTRGTDAIVSAWNDLPSSLRLAPELVRLFEAVKTCRDVDVPAQVEAPVAEPDHIADARKLVAATPFGWIHEDSQGVRSLKTKKPTDLYTVAVGTKLYTHPAPSAAEDAKDAERYRWLKSRSVECPTEGPDLALWSEHVGESIRGDEADKAIDAAMAKGGDAA